MILDSQCSSWKDVFSDATERPLPNTFVSICKIFANDTSTFSKTIKTISIVSDWVFHWKMRFNPDTKKQGNEVYFFSNSNAKSYLPDDLNNGPILICESQKHLGVILDKHLNFHEYIEKKIKICKKLIGTRKH